MRTSQNYYVLCFLIFLRNFQIEANNLNRVKRKLPLLHSGRKPEYLFICGFGIPLKNLHYETVTTGVVFKARYFLPTKSHQLYHQNITNLNGMGINKKVANDHSSRRERSIPNNTLRWHFYKLLEYYANNLGLNGRACVLKSICEVSQNPFYLDDGHLWQELAHIIFQPQTSRDDWPYDLPNEYVKAAEFQNNLTCHDLYKNCTHSLISQITKIFLSNLTTKEKSFHVN